MLYRRFGYIHSRLLLHLQDELRELEADLLNKDLFDARDDHEVLQSREMDEERECAPGESRGELLHKIEDKALQYGMYIIR